MIFALFDVSVIACRR